MRRRLSASFCAVVALALLAASPAGAVPGLPLVPTPPVNTPPPAGPAPPVSTPPPVEFGFNDTAPFSPQFGEPAFRPWLADSGADLHRWVASWQNYEPRSGELHPGYLDHLTAVYEADLSIGVRSIVQVFGAPRWSLDPAARKPLGGIPCKTAEETCLAPPNVRDPAVRSRWKGWVQLVAQRFPQAAAIEVWNEPNLHWSWVIAQDPPLYGLLVKATKEALVEIGSPLPVLTGGLSEVTRTDAWSTALDAMLKAVYQNAWAHFDAISYHSYPCAHHTDYVPHMQASLDKVRRVKTNWGDRSRPVWITETGASSGGTPADGCGRGFSERGQGDAITDVIDWAQRMNAQSGDLPVLIVHSLVNSAPRSDPSVPGSPSAEYGLVAWSHDPQGGVVAEPKPAYARVRCAMHGTDC